MSIPSLTDKLKRLTSDPGVYIMKDSSGEVLYVGKAKNLKNRVSSYFKTDNSENRAPKTELLLRKVADFEVAITDNEVEALLLEFNLIKKYKPRFNFRLKDDKSFPYVRVDSRSDFPRLEYVRKVKKDGAKYFGPYVSAYEIKELMKWAEKTFQLRVCSDAEFKNRSRPCILYQMGQCSAPCVGLIDKESYEKNIGQFLTILSGKTTDVLKEMKAQMLEASNAEDFEKAAVLRDRIQKIETVNEEQKITTDAEVSHSRDYVHFTRNDRGQAVVVLMSVRDGRTVGVSQFPFENLDSNLNNTDFLFGVLSQYYLRRHEESAQLLPREVLFPLELEEGLLEQAKVLSRALGKRVEFRAPQRGEAKDFILMVKKTADHHLSDLASKIANTAEDLIDTQKRLHLRNFPQRIECFDVSHFQGEGTVASRVVFIEGKPEKTLYRHYHVREVEGPDDFKSLREILERRFSHDLNLPSLVVIDGGKGQLAQAETIFQELGVIGVDLVSIAKARTERDFSEAEIKGSMERIFKPNQKNPVLLKPGTGAYRVLTQVRDESHRFAITFHRQVRSKQILKKS